MLKVSAVKAYFAFAFLQTATILPFFIGCRKFSKLFASTVM
jgi:hypothetical protein